MNSLTKKLPQIENKLSVEFSDKLLLAQAFLHRSFENEHKHLEQGNNERLEFLGDSILNFVVSEYLYTHLSDEEGVLSSIRASLVNSSACVRYVKKLEIEEYLLLGKGEEASGGRKKDSLLADMFEAVVGAIFLDKGLPQARSFLLDHFEKDFEEKIFSPEINHKAELQNFFQKKKKITPLYTMLKEEGPAHMKKFYVAVFIEDKEIGRGEGMSKKEAEARAAKNAVENLGIL